MKYNNNFFCITLLLFGFSIFIGIALSMVTLGNQLFPNSVGIVGILMITIFLIVGYGIFYKVICQLIGRQFKDGINESQPIYRIEKYILRWWKHRDPGEEEMISVRLIDTPGRRSRYPDDRKRQAVEKWDRIKRHPNGVLLEEFLESEFGISNGVLNVSKSTFYSWRRKLKKNREEE
jgi:hypothetical protein